MRIKVRQMCGGGTWRRGDWKPRRTAGALIFDAPGIAIVLDQPGRSEAWDEAAEAVMEWAANNPGPTGIPHDPPANPYDRDWGDFTFRFHGRWRDRLYDRFGSPRCWWPRGHKPVTHITAAKLPEPGVAIGQGFDGWSQRIEVTGSMQICGRCRVWLA